jgi:hypothetical protein
MHASEFPITYNIDFDHHYWLDAPAPFQASPLSEEIQSSVQSYIENQLTGIQVGRVDGQVLYHARLEGKEPLLIKIADEEFVASEMPGGHDPKTTPYGFGGVIGGVEGRRVHTGRNSWYFGMHVADLDLIPDMHAKHYDFAVVPHPAKIDQNSIFAVRNSRFGAVGDGVHDDTDALEKALQAAEANHGGTVYLGQGIYRVTRPLVVPTGTELRGPMDVVQNRAWYDTCTLLIDHGKDAPDPENAPAALTLNAHSGIQGISILYTSNSWDVGDDFRPYPYTLRGNGAGVWIVNVFMSNSYNAIDLASHRCDNFVVAGIWAAALQTGIRVGGGSRGGKLERCLMDWGPWPTCHFPKGNHSHAAQSYIFNHSTFYSFGDCENISAFALCGFNPRRECVFFDQNGQGPRNCEFWMLLFDVAKEMALDCEAGGSNSIYGLFATGGNSKLYNWVEGSRDFQGPLTVYAPTIQSIFVNHPITLQQSQLRVVHEGSLTTGRQVTATAFDPGHEPEKAVDGDDRTFWEALEGSSLTVDLGSEKRIRRWVVRNAGSYEPAQFNTWAATLEASTDGVNYTEIAKVDQNTAPWIDLPILPVPVEARYVRLKIITASNPKTTPSPRKARICGFDVYE